MRFLRLPSNRSGNNYSAVFHVIITIALPLLVFVLIRLDFDWVAFLLVILSKWRMFAVKARHWPANIRANAVDIFAGLSFVIFMVVSDTQMLQLFWAALYAVWLLLIKPRSTPIWIGIQAIIAQSLGLTAVFLYWSESPTLSLMIMAWGVSYLSARHFLSAFDEGMSRATAYMWAFFVASITWLSGHWLIFYGPIAQPALLTSVLAYGLASIYYLDHTEKLTRNVRLQFVLVMIVIVFFLILFSDWSDKTV